MLAAYKSSTRPQSSAGIVPAAVESPQIANSPSSTSIASVTAPMSKSPPPRLNRHYPTKFIAVARRQHRPALELWAVDPIIIPRLSLIGSDSPVDNLEHLLSPPTRFLMV
jgi:hypothetical protein